jgi:ketosteroid isomerase-like protein
MPALTPREVFEVQHERVLARDMEGQAGLFAVDGVWEFPFAAPPMPRRLEGREAIRAWSLAAVRGIDPGRVLTRYEVHALHETSDPEVLVVEFDLHGEQRGEPYRLPYIQVFRVRDGEIVSLRDYFSVETVAALSA